MNDDTDKPANPNNAWVGEAMKEAHKLAEADNVISFAEHQPKALIGPQTNPKDPDTPDWLGALPEQTTFLVAGHKDQLVVEVAEAYVERQTPIHTLLEFHMPTHSFKMWVNHANYSKLYKNQETIRTAEEQEEKDNGNHYTS